VKTRSLIMVVTATALVMIAPTTSLAGAPAAFEAKCKPCHSIGGVGGTMAAMGGPLDGVGSKRDAKWLTEYFKDPKSKFPEAKMPKMELTGAEWKELTDYMLSLK